MPPQSFAPPVPLGGKFLSWIYVELGFLGMAIVSTDKRWLQVNRKLCQMLGYSADELRLTTWETITHPIDLPLETTRFEELLAGQREYYSLEKRFLRKDGSVVHTRLHMRALRRHDRTVEHILCHVLELTEPGASRGEQARSPLQSS